MEWLFARYVLLTFFLISISCFALYSVHGSLRIATISDEKFFEVGLVDKLLKTVGGILRALQIDVQEGARL